MKKSIAIGIIVTALQLFPAASYSQKPLLKNTLGIVSAPLANVHDQPLPKSALTTQVLMGDEVRILEKLDYRYRISIPSQDNREGWIHQEAISLPHDGGRSYLDSGRTWIVIAAPKTDALLLDTTGNHKVPLYGGTRLPVLETTKDGLKVQLPNRSVAIIDPADTIASVPAATPSDDAVAEAIAQTARKFQGVRYLSGGITAQGMDIRGLIYIVYRIYGIPLSTVRASSLEKTDTVNKKNLQPGDILVFYGESEGLYLGNGLFLRSAKKGSVQVAGVHDRRYANALRYGLRIVGAGPNEKKTPAEMSADEVLLAQARIERLPLGKRIAYWAGRFVGTPYDPDPLGLYVRTERIVADEKADCMYHVFRSVELAESATPGEAVNKALDLRFITRGALTDGIVTNYDDRFQYGEDMIYSGKWGRNITADLGATRTIPGSRGHDTVDMLPKQVLETRTLQQKLQDGDIIYWVKDPKKRSPMEEIVTHLSIIQVKFGTPYLIHASGTKDREDRPGGGEVKEVPFADYVRHTHFIGALVTRFEPKAP